MEHDTLFTTFEKKGMLKLPNLEINFASIPWSKHPAFEGVELKHLLTGEQTNGAFSYHLVRIAPHKSIDSHIHEKQLETHEVISGTGLCQNNGCTLSYEPGVISVFPKGIPHKITAGETGLCLFAKFIPALD